MLLNPKCHYRIYKRPTSVPILSQINPVHAPYPIWILSSHLRFCLSKGLIPTGFPTKSLYELLLPPYVPHAPPILYFMIWSPEYYLVRMRDHKVPRYAVCSASPVARFRIIWYKLTDISEEYPTSMLRTKTEDLDCSARRHVGGSRQA